MQSVARFVVPFAKIRAKAQSSDDRERAVAKEGRHFSWELKKSDAETPRIRKREASAADEGGKSNKASARCAAIVVEKKETRKQKIGRYGFGARYSTVINFSPNNSIAAREYNAVLDIKGIR